jgi:hypothetical protein
MIGDATLQANDGRHPATGPEFSPEAIGLGAALQQFGPLSKLAGGQSPWGTGWGVVPEGLRASLPNAPHPLTDGPFADAERLRNLALGPPFLREAPGLQPSRVFPVGGCMIHASQPSTDLPKL